MLSVIASKAWRSTTHTHDTVRVWTATSGWSLLAVTENKGLASSRAQRGDLFTDPPLLRDREQSVAIHLPTLHFSVIASAAWRSSAKGAKKVATVVFCCAYRGLPRRGFDLLAVTNTSIIVIASAAWRSIAEPPLHRHRERSVAIHHSDFTDYFSRAWTATSSSLLAVTWWWVMKSYKELGPRLCLSFLSRHREQSFASHFGRS